MATQIDTMTASPGDATATPAGASVVSLGSWSAADAEAVNRRRVPRSPDAVEGVQFHVGNTAREGDVLPMIVCRLWEMVGGISAGVNGQVFLDGNDTLWVTSRKQDTAPGTWHWPERV